MSKGVKEEGIDEPDVREWDPDSDFAQTRREEESDTALDLPRTPRAPGPRLNLDDFASPAPVPRTKVVDFVERVPLRDPAASIEGDGRFERFGSYTLLTAVGVGGMAEVRLALGPTPKGRQSACVVKRVSANYADHPDFLAMFKEESRIARLLDHPRIVRAFDAGEVDGVAFIAFELIDGVSLEELKKAAGGMLPVSVVLEAGIGVAQALSYAHALKDASGTPLFLVHRDVSPDNVLVARGGGVKLVDFGIARFRGREHHTMHGQVKGKIRFMAPEQLMRTGVDQRTDLFSLGLMMADGLRLLQTNAMHMILSQVLPEAGGVPPDVHALLLALTKDAKEQRPESAAVVIAALTKLRASVSGPTLDEFAKSMVFDHRAPMDDSPELNPVARPEQLGGAFHGLVDDLMAFGDDGSDSYATILRNLSAHFRRGSVPPSQSFPDEETPFTRTPPKETIPVAPPPSPASLADLLASQVGLPVDRAAKKLPRSAVDEPDPTLEERPPRAPESDPPPDPLEPPTLRPPLSPFDSNMPLPSRSAETPTIDVRNRALEPLTIRPDGRPPLKLSTRPPTLKGVLAERPAPPVRVSEPPEQLETSWPAVVAIACMVLALLALGLAGLVLAGVI